MGKDASMAENMAPKGRHVVIQVFSFGELSFFGVPV
jgi:hypothetical protein